MTKTEYIRKMYAILAPMCAKFGYFNVAAGMIAQSIQEGWNSGLATKYHNYWGMKAGKSYKGKTVAMNNKAGNDPAVYRVYSSMEDGCDGYFVFLSYPKYQSLRKCTSDAEFLERIGPCGWNNNLGYGDRCKSRLKEVYAVIGSTEQPSQWQIGKTYTTQQDLYIRNNANGNKIYWDDLTENAKEHAFTDTLGHPILKKGTEITVKDIKDTGTCIWLKIPSGWICGKNKKNVYVL